MGSKSIRKVVQVPGVSVGRVAATAVVRESRHKWMVVLVLESLVVGPFAVESFEVVAFVLEAV
jgi:hypothetical protein